MYWQWNYITSKDERYCFHVITGILALTRNGFESCSPALTATLASMWLYYCKDNMTCQHLQPQMLRH